MHWTRRKFIKAGLLTMAIIGLIDSVWVEKFFIETNEFFLGSSEGGVSSIKVVQLSDLHIQSVNYQLRQLAKRLNTLKPDLILITGDAVDKTEKLHVLDKFLGLINLDIKKVAILGNWEYWGHVNLEALKQIYNSNNCDLLINESKRYAFNKKTIAITGVDDYVGGRADIAAALESYQQSDFHIVLNHCPEYSDRIFELSGKKQPINFILAGHTHGGQVNIFGYVPFTPQGSGRYLKGWYEDGTKKMYVSKGIGTSILPVRFMARAEIAIFNLAT
ncbi:metallophosphoesterase [Hymenobacter sp. BRD128]|uniref:metallophosphoesterase n=1 Tax=Hymenobacter sp. BRD128 TaxID=2675878 RepID=UPI0015656F32|nr:metallophosphoesterase [Hymenobacter sp. BRD128]QKG56274.1 metallophosphoesterase [Hymenobacter sp. BRD128]